MMIDIDIDESKLKATAKSVSFLEDERNRRTVIEAANEGLASAIRRHFATREKDSHRIGWWNLGHGAFPKRWFWRGTRGTSLAENLRTVQISPAKLETTVAVNSPALAHKLNRNPPPIRPKGGRRYLAIPANPVSAQWSGMARDFPGGVRFAYSRLFGHWLPSLVAATNYKKYKSSKRNRLAESDGKSGENEVVYWLVHKVQTRYDQNAMPSSRVQHSSVQSAVASAVAQLCRKAKS